MNNNPFKNPLLTFSEEVRDALHTNKPVVALESTVISHGLPYPQNVATAQKVEKAVRDNGAVPATIGIEKGRFVIGMDDSDIGCFDGVFMYSK